MDSPPEKAPALKRESFITGCREYWNGLTDGQRRRLKRVLIFGAILVLAFIQPLASLMIYASGEELHSHILLVPFVAFWLLNIQRDQLPSDYRTAPAWGASFVLAGLAILAAWYFQDALPRLSRNDRHTLFALGFLCLLVSGGFFFLGRKWMAAAAFPAAFLLFMVPLPDRLVDVMETASQQASAEAANWYFKLVGMPFLRDDNVFRLPGISMRVAQECSGIRSSWVLFITSLVAAHLFLKSPWRRTLFVALVIPLGILRNGFRILALGWLCVEVDPDIINGPLHHRGGPVFFALSLIPLFLVLWWLRRGELRADRKRSGDGPAETAPMNGVS